MAGKKKATLKKKPASKLKVGGTAPAFSLKTYGAEKVLLADYLGKWVVLYFYPKDMTPGCTTESCDFNDNLSKLRSSKAVVLGVSKDSVERHEKFRDKYGFKFPLLADETGAVCKKYGVWQEKSLYGRKFMGIVRTTFIIDPKGKIAKIYSGVKVKGHVDDVIDSIAALAQCVAV